MRRFGWKDISKIIYFTYIYTISLLYQYASSIRKLTPRTTNCGKIFLSNSTCSLLFQVKKIIQSAFQDKKDDTL